VLEPTRDPTHLAEFISSYEVPSTGRPAIEEIRRQYTRDIKAIPGRAASVNQLRIRTLAAVGEEHRSIVSALDVLTDWALSAGVEGPRLLLLVGAGFDENPDEFYIPLAEGLSPGVQGDLRSRFGGFNSGEQVQKIAAELAGKGWRVITVAAGAARSTTSASEDGSHRVRSFLTDSQSTQIEPGALVLDPILGQRRIAQPSGGDVAVGGQGVETALAGANGWYRLSYQAARPPDGADHGLAVTASRSGVTVRAPEVVASESSEAQVELRLQRLLDGAVDRGRLPVSASVGGVHSEGKGVAGTLEVETDLAALRELMAALGGGVFRVSVLVRSGDQESVGHQSVTLGTMGGFVHTMDLEWKGSEGQVAVVVEELTSGEWGGVVVGVP
ncbi:MAG: hypothetical protein K8J08_04485, partial [Thermoanaerobaculia bacterium]|nr:hypothetical protein [Thermoanaerobaculia bacterium]